MKQSRACPLAVGVLSALSLAASSALAGVHYRLERVASGLDQPTFLTQAPGDPANIVYYTERITAATGTGGGFGTVNNMGGIFRYDLNTGSATQVMNLSHRQLTGDEGIAGFAFSPDFNIPGSPGYQKMYVSTAVTANPPISRVEEYTVSGPGGTVPLDGLGRPVVSRLVLQYNHINNQQNHTVNWVGFDPTTYSLPVGSPERNYLHVSTGDGALGNTAQTRPEQKANTVLGKVLRVDVDAAHGDAYAGDANKNFAIPPTNPIPLWNSTHSATEQLGGTRLNYSAGTILTADYAPALGEIFFTGTRNTYRMSFDRQTGDYWMGDVGENAREEVNFLKAGPYNGSQPPVDFGYPSREGTIPTGGSTVNAGSNSIAGAVTNSFGATSQRWNLVNGSGTITGSVDVASVNPVREGDHSSSNTPDHPLSGRSSYIGGYVYRGPIAELQGKYIYADFVHSNVFTLENFDRNIPLSSYSGTNFNHDTTTWLAALGTRTHVASGNVNSFWNTLIIDPDDPGYTAALGSVFGIGRVVSFGEDQQGNVYIIDMGGNRGDPSFGQDYPNAGLGEIFRLTPATINTSWNQNSDSAWLIDGNWTGGIPTGAPNGVGDTATFGSVITGPRTVTVNSPLTVSRIAFGSAHSYTIAGTNAITLAALSPSVLAVNSGTHTISAPLILGADLNVETNTAASQLLLTGAVTATGRTITKLGPGLVQFENIRAAALNANQGIVKISSKITDNNSTGTSVVGSLVIGGGGGDGRLDLTNNALIVDYTGPIGTLLADTRANLVSGDLFTSAPTQVGLKGLGYADNAVLHKTSFAGQTVNDENMLVMFTFRGDANLDGDVDLDDVSPWSLNFTGELGGVSASKVWTDGDWDYDGDVDLDDVGLWSLNFTGELGMGQVLWVGDAIDTMNPAAISALNSLGITVAPEPGTPVLMLAAAAVLTRRRRTICG